MKQLKVLICKGLPASGKTTFAHKLVKESGGAWKRVNKDEMRVMVDAKVHSNGREKMICNLRDAFIDECLSNGYNVVVDDTNFSAIHEKNIRKVVGDRAEVEVMFFDIDPKTAIKRDLERTNSVGKDVIMRMYRQNVLPALCKPVQQDNTLPPAVIFDIDGTLAEMAGRSPYDYTKVDTDAPKKDIIGLTWMFDFTKYKVFCFSGRPESCREETEAWLQRHGVRYEKLFMRETGNTEKDWIIKRRLLENLVKEYRVVYAVDDRDQVVDMWRASGITCLQVNYGDF